MMHHGLVIRILKNKVIVSTSDFQCFYIKRSPTNYIGSQVEFTEKDIIKKRSILTKLALSAACIAIIFVMAYFSNLAGLVDIRHNLSDSKVFAYIDVDINPSIEFEIDDTGSILEVTPINGDAKALVKKLNLDNISVSKAIGIIIEELKKNKVISEIEENCVMVSGTLNSNRNEQDKEYQNRKGKYDILMNSIKDNLQEEGKVSVFLVHTSIHERKDALNEGMSSGRYTLYKEYKDQGSSSSIEEIRSADVRELLKDILNKKGEKDILENTHESTPLPMYAEDTMQIVSATPSAKDDDSKQAEEKDINPGLNGNIQINSDSTKNNNTNEAGIILNTPTTLMSHTPLPSPKIQSTNSLYMKFESFNYPGQFIRHQFFKARISPDVTPEDDAIFKIVPGLADPDCISFESKNFPGHYLMHENFNIILKKNDSSVNFKECATFRKVPGLADKNLISMQSYNYPKRYIRHVKFYLKIDEIINELERKDATYAGVKVE